MPDQVQLLSLAGIQANSPIHILLPALQSIPGRVPSQGSMSEIAIYRKCVHQDSSSQNSDSAYLRTNNLLGQGTAFIHSFRIIPPFLALALSVGRFICFRKTKLFAGFSHLLPHAARSLNHQLLAKPIGNRRATTPIALFSFDF